MNASSRRPARRCAALLIACVAIAPVQADTGPPQENSARPLIGLALSGGGARGGAHVGVLMALEELGVRPDMIAGTSMGAIIGGFYAAGLMPAEIEAILAGTDWASAFNDEGSRGDRPFRRKLDDEGFLVRARLGFNDGEFRFPLGFIQGQHVEQILNRATAGVAGVRDFDNLRVPFRAVATELATGNTVVLGKGNLASALRASMAVPTIFAPAELDGRLLADGGLAQNLPVETVKAMGADIVIAVDISTPLTPDEKLRSVVAVTDQLANLLTRANVADSLALLRPGDILIVPDLAGISSADFRNAAAAVPRGRDAALAQRDALSRLARGGTAHRPAPLPAAPATLDFIELDNDSRLSDATLRSRIRSRPGDALDRSRLERDVDRIYGLGVFEKVSYRVISREGRTGARIVARETSWGPNYLQLGIALSDDFSGSAGYRLGLAHTRPAISRHGGERRIEASIGRELGLAADWYLPLDHAARWFVNPAITLLRRDTGVFDDTRREIGRARVSTALVATGAGRNFGDDTELRATLRAGKGELEPLTGLLPSAYDQNFDIGEIELSLRYDDLDNLYFPTRGGRGALSFRRASALVGADESFAQVSFSYLHALTFGHNTLLASSAAGTTLDNDAPLYREFTLGGFTRLTGLQPDQLNGQHFGLLGLTYYRQLDRLLGRPFYVGGGIETGNVYARRGDAGFGNALTSGSAFLGFDTLLGPVYLGWGLTEGGAGTAFLFVGNPF